MLWSGTAPDAGPEVAAIGAARGNLSHRSQAASLLEQMQAWRRDSLAGLICRSSLFMPTCACCFCRQKDFRDGRFAQLTSSALDSKLRDDLERLKKIRRASWSGYSLRIVSVRVAVLRRHGCVALLRLASAGALLGS